MTVVRGRTIPPLMIKTEIGKFAVPPTNDEKKKLH